jgi:hypothetical protein
MIALDSTVNTTYQPKALDFANDRPAIIRTGADIALPVHTEDTRLCKLFGSATSDRLVLISLRPDAWMAAVLETISTYRNTKSGWDGQNANAVEQTSLDASEMLAVLLSNYPRSTQLTFSVDTLGRPSFAGRGPDFYLHLTVDDANHITWFAEKSGIEYFGGEVEFSGRRIPSDLPTLLS